MYNNPKQGIVTLYISPLKALINDQFSRLKDILSEKVTDVKDVTNGIWLQLAYVKAEIENETIIADIFFVIISIFKGGIFKGWLTKK